MQTSRQLPMFAVLLIGVAACAPTNPVMGEGEGQSARNPCFDVATLRNYRAVQGRTLYVRSSRDEVFELQSVGACNDLDGAVGLALVPDAGSISRLCIGDGAVVRARSGVGSTGPCRVRVTALLTPDQVAALPDRDRP